VPSGLACTSESVDRRTQLVTAVDWRQAQYGDLEAPISDALATGKRAVVVDLSSLGALPPSVLDALGRARRRLSWRNGTLAVVCRPELAGPLAPRGSDGSIAIFDVLGDAFALVGADHAVRWPSRHVAADRHAAEAPKADRAARRSPGELSAGGI
jgi:hypothetical protein